MLGIGQKQQQIQQPQYQQGIPVATNDSHDLINSGVKELDTEIQKYFLNVDPLLNAYNCVFSGWVWVNKITKYRILGIEKLKEERKLEIDWTSRSVNESGSNFLWHETLPLIHQTAATSKNDRSTLYDLWHTHIFTIRMTLLKTYLYPTYMCMEKVERKNNDFFGIETEEEDSDDDTSDSIKMTTYDAKPKRMKSVCRFLTPSQRVMDRHAEKHNHYDNIEIIENPYELNPQRYGNIISMMITLYGIAMKADKGFAMEQFAQSFQTATLNRIGLPSVQQQTGGLTQGLKRLGIG